MFCKLAVTFAILASSMLLPVAVRADEDVTIARLVMRDRTVVIYQGKGGARYSVKDKDGDLLHADLSEVELAEKYPDIYDQVRPAYADGETPSLMMMAW
ncbi:hypothetical protein HC931_10615 [Candidatus Gracilibacteria bacterium]|nr:hypothetical protein [Candidatus Gracilibacteria bacterium]NJM89018.1 hypothetical protein [Hydrococcus sp. RU_2_2]NJP18426.1 hypothetical protein [Hydrococcus sp. CRU_1_1]NJQ98793.1 hypothetical protein [Hydrococcus sp. CSU_1_8]